MNDDALLEAIYAAPDDDAPRLVYADALLERGDVRGELIVRQCRGDSCTDLTEPFGRDWLGELSDVIETFTFERGFLATVTTRPEAVERVGHPMWRTVRRLQGALAVALHPSMTALRELHVRGQREWAELFTGTPRPITELHYTPNIVEDWDPGGDITATPHSGGIWTTLLGADEIAAISSCSALPSLQRLEIREAPAHYFLQMVRGTLLDRVPNVVSRFGPIDLKIAAGLAVFTLAPNTATPFAEDVIELARGLPVRLDIELRAEPRFPGRSRIEQALGHRLRR